VGVGYFYRQIKSLLNPEKPSEIEDNKKFGRKLKEKADRVEEIYNTQGEKVSHEDYGRYLDFFA
jgi:hypothetical protein